MLEVLAVLSLLCVAATQECPQGSYKTSPVVFGCSGGFGEVNLTVPANSTSSPLNIPLGAEGFRASATSSAGALSLRLRDEVNHVLVASQDHGLVNHSVRAGVYKDVGVVMSKRAESAKENVSLYLLGALTAPMQLAFCNENNSAVVTVAYTFERVLECKFPPEGCAEYNEEEARWQVEVWSHWASSHYNVTEAWAALAEPHAEREGVAWSSWPQVWAAFIGNATEAGEEWQPGFSYLDQSRDGFVSQDEFAEGFALSKARASKSSEETVDIVSDATEALRENQWIVFTALAVLMLMLLLCCWRCRPKRDSVARSVSQLSRDVKAHTTHKRVAASMLESAPAPSLKVAGMEAFPHEMPKSCPGAGLWLFPQIGQGLGAGLPLWHQESFRYSQVAVEEHPDTRLPAVGSFSMQAPQDLSGTWSSQTPQLGSFTLPPFGGSAVQDAWPRPETLSFQVQLPRADPIFHQGPPAAPGVVQAELAGPVQVEQPLNGAQDGWDRLAAAISPALRAEISP